MAIVPQTEAARRVADNDNFPTPAGVTRAVLPLLGVDLPLATILEPSAGEGGIVRVLLAAGARPDSVTWVELHRERAEAAAAVLPDVYGVCGDFLEWSTARHLRRAFDLIIGNPPYSGGAMQCHVEAALPLLAPGGVLAMLLPVRFAASLARVDLHRTHPPEMHILSPRVRFTADGGTPNFDVAWFIWRHGVSEPQPWAPLCWQPDGQMALGVGDE